MEKEYNINTLRHPMQVYQDDDTGDIIICRYAPENGEENITLTEAEFAVLQAKVIPKLNG